MSHWHQIAHSTGRLIKLAHALLTFINFCNLHSVSMSVHFNISDILRSKSLNFEPFKLLEAPDLATQFEIPEDGDLRLHLYENLKYWFLFTVASWYYQSFSTKWCASFLKGILKFTLKQLRHVSVRSPSPGSVLFELAKVTMLKQSIKIHRCG